MKISSRPFGIENGHYFAAWSIPTLSEPVSELALPSGARVYHSFPTEFASLWEGRLGRFQIAELEKCDFWVVASGHLLTERPFPAEGLRARGITFTEIHAQRLYDWVKTVPEALALLRVPTTTCGWLTSGLSDRKGPLPAEMPMRLSYRSLANLEPFPLNEALLLEADKLIDSLVSIEGKRLRASLLAFFDSMDEGDFCARASAQIRALRALCPPEIATEDASFIREAALFTGGDVEFLPDIIALCRAADVLDSPRVLCKFDAATWTDNLIRLEETTRETLRRIVSTPELRTLFKIGEFWNLSQAEQREKFGLPVDCREIIRINAERNAADEEQRKQEQERKLRAIPEGLSRWVRPRD